MVLYEPIARWKPAADFPWAPTADEFAQFVAQIRAGWGTQELAARWVASGAAGA